MAKLMGAVDVSRKRSLVAVSAALVLLALAGAVSGEAARRPSATITINCTRDVTYFDWTTQAPAIEVSFYPNTGGIADSSGFIYCPDGGGRYRYKAYLTEQWPLISVACFRSNDYEIGETDQMNYPASGTCTDDGGSGLTNLGTFATWTVR
jgi:hypothetical protein